MKLLKQAVCLICMFALLAMPLTMTASALGSVWVWADPSEKEPITDYAYTFVAVGDTQIICESHPESMAKLYDWIVNNVETKKIAYVFGLGDITNHTTSGEWLVAKREIAKLDGVVPYSLVRGNHDKGDHINQIFATDKYMSQFEGFYQEGKMENTWRTFSVAGVDYLFINMDYGASDAILKWAGKAIEAHPHHRVIICTHAYMHRNGVRLVPAVSSVSPNPKGLTDGSVNNGQQMWTKLFSKYENIFMVLSGHVSTDNVEMSEAKGVHGNTVYQFLIDPQGLDADIGATGMVAILYFSEDGKKVTVEQYSTARDKYYRSTSQFSFEIPEYDPHSFTSFVPDGNATCLSAGTETATCDGCDKTLTRDVEGNVAEHSYIDGICAVCGAAAPVSETEPAQTEKPTEAPVEDTEDKSPAGGGQWIVSALLPSVLFLGAVIVGYLLGKKYKRK